MIVPMKKVTLLSVSEERIDTLQRLRALGVIHLKAVTQPRSQELDNSTKNLQHAKSVQVSLDSCRKNSKIDKGEMTKLDTDSLIDDASALLSKKTDITRTRDILRTEKKQVEPFGDFDPALIESLFAHGLMVKLFEVPKKNKAISPENAHLFVLNQKADSKYLAIIAQQDFEFEGKEHPVPKRRLKDIEREIEKLEGELMSIESKLAALSRDPMLVKTIIEQCEAEVEFLEAKESMGVEKHIVYLQGFVPSDKTEALLEASRKNGWGLKIEEPGADDRVPTLIKSPEWVKPIKSLFSLLDILPGYDEVDIRSVFFLFFGLFLAMIVSDAGYGLLFLVFTFVFRALFKKAPAGPFILSGILSVCAIIWGVLTGSYFGIEHLPPVLSAAKIEWLNNEEHIMLFAFFIGAVHLTIAHAWKAILTINSTRALGQCGWIIVTWAAFFLTKFLILGHELPSWFMILVGIGIGMVAVFMTPFNKLKTEWADHVMLPFDLVGSFADLVSYVRLFAVGSASLAVAESFNELAIGNGVESLTSAIIAAVILFLGHSLNIVLALMSILVHGVRLNTLEFSGHIGLEWSGFKYYPFAQNKNSKEDK